VKLQLEENQGGGRSADGALGQTKPCSKSRDKDHQQPPLKRHPPVSAAHLRIPRGEEFQLTHVGLPPVPVWSRCFRRFQPRARPPMMGRPGLERLPRCCPPTAACRRARRSVLWSS